MQKNRQQFSKNKKQKRLLQVELEELQRYSQGKSKELVVLQASLEGEKEELEARINAAKAAAAKNYEMLKQKVIDK